MKRKSSKHNEFWGLLLIGGLLTFAGCAKIADPLPPLIRIPKPADDLAVYQLADSIVLRFSKPVVNTDGSPANSLKEIRVLCLSENVNSAVKVRSLTDEAFREKAEQALKIESTDFSNYLDDGAFIIRDPLTPSMKSELYSSSFHFAVLLINDKRQAAG